MNTDYERLAELTQVIRELCRRLGYFTVCVQLDDHQEGDPTVTITLQQGEKRA